MARKERKDGKKRKQGRKEMKHTPAFLHVEFETSERNVTTHLSMRREVNPEPVPPPKEWKMRNP